MHSTFLGADGGVWTVGLGDGGRLGHGDVQSLNRIKRVENLPPCVMVKTGGSFTACVTDSGELFCFGDIYGPWPVQLDLPPIESVACGADFLICVGCDFSVWTFGHNDKGQMGLDHNEYCEDPVRLEGLRARQVACGAKHVLILCTNGQVYGYGVAKGGELGGYRACKTPTLIPIPANAKVDSVHCGFNYSILRAEDGTVWSAGSGDCAETDEFVQIPDLVTTQIACGSIHVIAIDNDHRMWAWGANNLCSLPFDSEGEYKEPTLVEGALFRAVKVEQFASFFCTTDDDQVIATGLNNFGQLSVGFERTTVWLKVSPYITLDMIQCPKPTRAKSARTVVDYKDPLEPE